MESGAADLYLDLLRRVLTRELHWEEDSPWRTANITFHRRFGRRVIYGAVQKALERKGLHLMVRGHCDFDPVARELGRDWPTNADTMVGLQRLRQLQHCVHTVVTDDVPGDLMETGVWRGGASIFMRAALAAYGDQARKVWLADSFRGLPAPDPRYPADAGLAGLNRNAYLAVSVDEVKKRFARYGLLDDRVKFLEGWFKDTLPDAPVERLAVLRLDGDLYQSTFEALDALYPKLSPGGFLIVDDYGCIEACKAAVTDYRNMHGILEPITDIDGSGVYWRRREPSVV